MRISIALAIGIAALSAASEASAQNPPFISADPNVVCTTLEVIGDQAIFEGDVVVGTCIKDGNGQWTYTPNSALGRAINGTQGRAGLATPNRYWPGGVMPYIIDNSLSEANAPDTYHQIRVAMRHWQDRTHVRLIPRTTETAYINFNGVSGSCSSPIGRTGVQQTINLDSAGLCGVGAAIHEIGHSAGIYHEQSRTDRDTYVTINSGNIKSGKEHNFDKYSTGVDHGAYDYGSIMHYGRTAFSNNGNPTIDTNNPQFTDWQAIYGNIDIGQRVGLSVLDVAAIDEAMNLCVDQAATGSPTWSTSEWIGGCETSCGGSAGRTRKRFCHDALGMCAPESTCNGVTPPATTESCHSELACDFDTDNCGWDLGDSGDDFDWTAFTKDTPSGNTGPSLDHTTGDDGFYVYIEGSSPRSNGEQAYLTSVPVTTNPGATITFWYHTFGGSVQPLVLQSVDCANPGSPTTLWTSDGVSADVWREQTVALPTGSDLQLRFVGTVGGGFSSDVAIDDISVSSVVPVELESFQID